MYKIIGPMNVFPFVLAIGIMVQGTIFAIEQSKGLDSLLILGCEPISQVMLPGTYPTVFCINVPSILTASSYFYCTISAIRFRHGNGPTCPPQTRICQLRQMDRLSLRRHCHCCPSWHVYFDPFRQGTKLLFCFSILVRPDLESRLLQHLGGHHGQLGPCLCRYLYPASL